MKKKRILNQQIMVQIKLNKSIKQKTIIQCQDLLQNKNTRNNRNKKIYKNSKKNTVKKNKNHLINKEKGLDLIHHRRLRLLDKGRSPHLLLVFHLPSLEPGAKVITRNNLIYQLLVLILISIKLHNKNTGILLRLELMELLKLILD